MSVHDDSVREKIILATIECIEKEGLHAVTIRGIAREAGVNSAAINYYFRSKENLIDATLQQTIDHAIMDLTEILDDNSIPPRKVLRSFFMYLLEGSLRYPEMTKAHFYDPILRNKYNVGFNRWIATIFDKIQKVFLKEYPEYDKTDIRLMLIQMLSAVIFHCLVPDMYNNYLDTPLKDLTTQYRYVDTMLDHYFGKTE